MINSTPDSIDFMELDASIKGKDKGSTISELLENAIKYFNVEGIITEF